jgi:hypothetical protein
LASRLEAVLVLLLFLLLRTVPGRAQDPKTSIRQFVTLAGTVDRVDRFSRTLTLRSDHDQTQTVYVAPEVKIFDELKTGDKVTVRLIESVIVAVRSDVKPGMLTDTTEAANKTSATGQGEVLQQLKAVVTIEHVDLSTRMVTYKTADNRRLARAVLDAHLLDGLKPGDVIEITYTRERAIGLERQR